MNTNIEYESFCGELGITENKLLLVGTYIVVGIGVVIYKMHQDLRWKVK